MNVLLCHNKYLLTNKIRKIPSSGIKISLINKRLAQLKSKSRSYIVNAKNENLKRLCDLHD